MNKEFLERLVSIGRCTKVTKGGRRFSFSALVVVGNQYGVFGYGMGKAIDVMEARQKAVNRAKKNIYKIKLKDQRTIHYETIGKFCSSKIIIKPAYRGRGIIAGGVARLLFEVIGIKDILAKSIKSNNPSNIIKAVVKGLLKVKDYKNEKNI